MGLCAWFFYGYNVLVIGLWLLPFILNLVITGWVIGVLTTSLIMRFGQEAEILAWSLVFLIPAHLLCVLSARSIAGLASGCGLDESGCPCVRRDAGVLNGGATVNPFGLGRPPSMDFCWSP